jgi:outer membrane receptor for ferrienterochelin and colicins
VRARAVALALAVGCALALGSTVAVADPPMGGPESPPKSPGSSPKAPDLVRARGTVRDLGERPLAGATVMVLSEGTVVAEVRTDAEGRFETPPFPAGAYTVRASKVGFGDSIAAIDPAAITAPLAVVLAPREAGEALDVEVRGARAPEPNRNAASEAVVTRAMLDALPGGDNQTLVDVLNTQPGFVVDSYGFIHARTNDGNIAYVIDGVPLLTLPLGQFQTFIPMRLVQELKVVTGGFPAEYGIGNGAVVDITTRRPTGAPSGQVEIAYGSYQLVSPQFDYAQQIGNLGVLLGGSLTTTHQGLPTQAASPVLHDDMLSGKAFARLDYRLGAHDHLELVGGYAQTHYQIPIDPTLTPLSAGPPGAVRGVDSYGNPAPVFVPYDANPTEDERDFFVSLVHTHTTSDGGASHVAGYVRESYGSLRCDPAGSLGPTADPGSTCADDLRDVLHEGAVADYAWKVGAHQVWKAGGQLDFAEGNDGYAVYTRDDTAPGAGPDPSRTVSGTDRMLSALGGVYLQDTIKLGAWTLLPGARADMQRVAYLDTPEPALLLAGPSGRLGVSYAPSRETVLHAYVGRFWQPPPSLDAPVAARILVPAFAGRPVPVDLKAETDWYAEVGVSQRFLGQITAGLTAYGRLSQDLLDRTIVGSTNLYESYNFTRGRAAGVEASIVIALRRYVDGFANAGWQLGQGQGTASAAYLFTPQQLAYTGWVTLDHVQSWTANVSFDLHDEGRTTHLSGLFNYGSGMRTGDNDTLSVPGHSTLDLTLRHRFDFWRHVHPEIAVDVFNVFNEVYATRLGNGFVGSAYGPLRHADVRLIVPFAR